MNKAEEEQRCWRKFRTILRKENSLNAPLHRKPIITRDLSLKERSLTQKYSLICIPCMKRERRRRRKRERRHFNDR
jgi:hypothetical protein